MVEYYRCKPRLSNPETYVEVIENGKKYKVTHFFQGGRTFEEEWDLKYFNLIKKQKMLIKVPSITWRKGEEECQQKKKTQPKKKSVKKVTPKKKELKTPPRKKVVAKPTKRKKATTKKMVPIEALLKKNTLKTMTI